MSQLSLSVVMPAYNEAEAIEAAIRDIVAEVLPHVPSGEIVVVNDGSKDATPAILDRLATEIPQLRVIHQPNGGHGAAVMNGIAQAKGEVLLLLDSDRQISLADFPAHWAALTGGNLMAVLGVRKKRHDPAHRLVVTRAMRAVIAATHGIHVRDGNIPYKLVRAEAWRQARPAIPADSWIPSVLLAIFLRRRHKGRIKLVEITHLPRTTGETTLNWKRLSRFCVKATSEIAGFRPPVV